MSRFQVYWLFACDVNIMCIICHLYAFSMHFISKEFVYHIKKMDNDIGPDINNVIQNTIMPPPPLVTDLEFRLSLSIQLPLT